MIEKALFAANDFIATHPDYGLMFAFLVAFAESLPLLGTIIPGSLTMTLIGVLVGRNLLPLGLTLLLGFIGAILGDLIGFVIGMRFQGRLHQVWPFNKYEKLLRLIGLGETFFKKHGGKSIVIGRFIGPTRSSVPLIAGLLRMRWPNFIAAAIPSAFLWALLYLLPGVLIGAISMSLPKEQAAWFTLIGFGLVVLIWLIFWALQRFFSFTFDRINQGVKKLWKRLRSHSPTLKNWLTTIQNPKDHHQLTMAIFAFVFWILFTIIFFSVHHKVGIYLLNQPVFFFLQSIRNPWSDEFFVIMTQLGETPVIIAITVLCALSLSLEKNYRAAIHLLALIFTTCALLWGLKHGFYHPRPSGFIRIDKTSSFPSGHTTLAVTLFGFLAYLNAHNLKKYWLWLSYTIAGIIIACVAISRLYLGAHWLCDVLAGLCLGMSLLLIFLVSYRRKEKRDPRHSKQLLILTLASILSTWGFGIMKHYHRDLYRYRFYYSTQTLSLTKWWQFPSAYVPNYRENRLGQAVQPLNLQWAGDLSLIEKTLKTLGWEKADEEHNLQNTLARFANKDPESNLAYLPVLYRSNPPVLFMINHPIGKKGLYELRLWEAGVDFEDANYPLYVGTINYHRPGRSYISLKPNLLISLKQGGGIYSLSTNLEKTPFMTKFIRININGVDLPHNVESLDWDQRILVIKPRS